MEKSEDVIQYIKRPYMLEQVNIGPAFLWGSDITILQLVHYRIYTINHVTLNDNCY